MGVNDNDHGLDPNDDTNNDDTNNDDTNNDDTNNDDISQEQIDQSNLDDGLHRPEGIKPELVGKSDQETIDNLLKENTAFRTKQAAGKPTKAEEFKFELSDKAKGAMTIGDNDALVGKLGELALARGMDTDQFGVFSDVMDFLVEQGAIEKPFDTTEALKSFAPDGFKGTDAEIEAKGAEVLATSEAWIDQLPGGADGYSDGEKAALRLLTTDKDGMGVLAKMMKGNANPSLNSGDADTTGGITKADLDKRVADPRNDSTDHEKFEPAFAQETDRLFKKLYPSG